MNYDAASKCTDALVAAADLAALTDGRPSQLDRDSAPVQQASDNYGAGQPASGLIRAAPTPRAGAWKSGAGELGQLVLSVDFAPPACRSNHFMGAGQREPNQLALPSSHMIEASLCIRQQDLGEPGQPGESGAERRQTAPSGEEGAPIIGWQSRNYGKADHSRPDLSAPSTSDIVAPPTRSADATSPRTANKWPPTTTITTKRRLVYERLDRFLLELGRPFEPVAARRQLSLPSAGLVARRIRLPLKSGGVDSCLCFNLLNVRVASARLLALEQLAELEAAGQRDSSCWSGTVNLGSARCENYAAGGATTTPSATSKQPSHANQLTRETRDELEWNWLQMDRLTTELRLALLAELGRVVRPNGEFFYLGYNQTGALPLPGSRQIVDLDTKLSIDPVVCRALARGANQLTIQRVNHVTKFGTGFS